MMQGLLTAGRTIWKFIRGIAPACGVILVVAGIVSGISLGVYNDSLKNITLTITVDHQERMLYRDGRLVGTAWIIFATDEHGIKRKFFISSDLCKPKNGCRYSADLQWRSQGDLYMITQARKIEDGLRWLNDP